MLEQITNQPGVREAIVVTTDGLARAFTGGLGRDEADSIAAALAGVRSTGTATAALCGAAPDSWQRSLVEFNGGYVITVWAGEATHLSVGTTGDADVEQIHFRMHEVVATLGRELGAQPRSENTSA